MRVNRTLLYAGIFLVAIGGVVVAIDLGILDERILTDALGLWPLAVIALGAGLVLRRTRASLSSGLLAAAVPGLLIGSAFAVAPRFAGFCATIDEPTTVLTRDGMFDGLAHVSVATDCGSLRVTTEPGAGWRLDARTTEEGRAPIVDASAGALSIESSGHDRWLTADPDDWDLHLPTSEISDLALAVNAGRGDVDLAGASVDRLAITANASEVVVDAASASIAEVTGVISFAQLSILLPDGDISASFDVDAGHARVCLPDGVGLRVTSTSDAGNVSVAGVDQSGIVWISPEYTSAEHRADLEINVDFGAVEINPIGGCR